MSLDRTSSGEIELMIRPVILLTIGAVLLLMAIRKMRQLKLKERYALTFIFVALPFFFLAVWPDALSKISTLLGISYFTVMLLLVSVFLILMVFELLTIVSVLDSKVSTLAQMVGIHHERLRLVERVEVPEACVLEEDHEVAGVDRSVGSGEDLDPVVGSDRVVVKPALTFKFSGSSSDGKRLKSL